MEITGYLAAAFIGISLGLTGGGGSVLTVPVLVYLFHLNPVPATAYSLFVVGTSSAAGVLPKFKQGTVDPRIALTFGAPSFVVVFLFRKVIVPLIPEIIIQNHYFTIQKDDAILIMFAALMILASLSMLRGKEKDPDRNFAPSDRGLIVNGIATGIVAGLLGAGGGFIIIPSLVVFAGLDIKKAVGTSLLIIAVNSLIGFTGDLFHFDINWPLLLSISVLAIAGTIVGNYISGFISSGKLKKIFGWFILGMGAIILITEIL